jgi:hypothetical protein
MLITITSIISISGIFDDCNFVPHKYSLPYLLVDVHNNCKFYYDIGIYQDCDFTPH